MSAAPRRNVLFITSDQWRGDCLSALGHPCIKTPNYDALIEDGILFRNHYTVCTPCGPSRASLLTGMYLQNHRVVQNGAPLDNRHSNLARELRRAGYRPTLFGYTDTSLDPRAHDEATVIRHGYENMLPGFEEGMLLTDGDPQPWLRYLRVHGYQANNAADAYKAVDNYPHSESRGKCFVPSVVKDEHSQTAFLTKKVIEFVDAAEPGWCVHLSYLRPHPPFIASEPWNAHYHPIEVPRAVRAKQSNHESCDHPFMQYAIDKESLAWKDWADCDLGSEKYDRELRQLQALYFGLVSKVDHYLGILIRHLQVTGQYDNTLIVLTGDHGELLGDHWLLGKRCWFDSAFHVPLIIRDPDQPPTTLGTIETAFTESVDVMPTILDSLGLPIPRQCDGYSLAPYVRGEKPDNPRTELHWEYDFRDMVGAQSYEQWGIKNEQCQFNVIRNKRYKYVHFNRLPGLFFDLKKDPGEFNNVIADPQYAADVLAMTQKLLSWRMSNDERTLTNLQVTRIGILEH